MELLIATEIARTHAIRDLHTHLTQLCSRERLNVPRQVFQRFLFECHLCERGLRPPRRDPLLPEHGERSQDLRRGLRDVQRLRSWRRQPTNRATQSDEAAVVERICEAMGRRARELIDDLPRRSQQWLDRHDDCSSADLVRVSCDDRTSIVRLDALGAAHRIHSTAYAKFQRLHRLHGGPDADDQAVFQSRLFAMLQRYASLGSSGASTVNVGVEPGGANGSGFHAALTEHTMNFLHRHLGVTMECFASPFNAYFDQFCSAFEDTDRWFGSRGSFFDFKPTEGSFEWNPPFLEDVMEAGVTRLRELLDSTDRPLSFVIVLPNWVEPPTPSIEMLRGSRFKAYRRADLVQPKGRDQWRDGFPHPSETKYFIAPWDGRLFIVQNDAGATEWPVTEQLLSNLLETFSHSQ